MWTQQSRLDKARPNPGAVHWWCESKWTKHQQSCVQYGDIYHMTTEKRSFRIMLYHLFHCVHVKSSSAYGKFAWREQKRTWRTVNMRQNEGTPHRRRTPTSQDKTRSSYLREGLPLSMDSLTRARKMQITLQTGRHSRLKQHKVYKSKCNNKQAFPCGHSRSTI